MKSLIHIVLGLVVSGSCIAETWTVDDDGKADFDNIQAAVDAASDGDNILVMRGTYSSTDTVFPYSVMEITNKSLTVFAMHGPDETFIDGQNNNLGIICSGKSTVIIQNFNIRNCNQVDHDGGGMYCYDNSPTIINCIFTNNRTDRKGGGLYFDEYSNPTIVGCTISSNGALDGGGIFCASGAMNLTNTTVCGNYPNQVSGEYVDSGGNEICENSITWTVDDDGEADFDNIQAAVDAASDGDEIVVMPGTYTSNQNDGVVNINDRFLTVRSSDPDDPAIVAATIIDGENERRGISCYNYLGGFKSKESTMQPELHIQTPKESSYSRETSNYEVKERESYTKHALPNTTNGVIKIEGFTIVNGDAGAVLDGLVGERGGCEWINGGGISSIGVNLVVSNCSITDCLGWCGSGIYINMSESGYSTVDGCTINSNSTFDGTICSGGYNWCWGGGISSLDGGYLEVSNCTINGNVSHYTGGAIGVNDTDLTLINCYITNNSVVQFKGEKTNDNWTGGVSIQNGNLSVSGCSFIGNNGVLGGGLKINNFGPWEAQIDDCLFKSNTVSVYQDFFGLEPTGAGILTNGAEGTELYVTSSTFINNIAGFGGGVSLGLSSNYDTGTYISDCSFHGNSASLDGGGIYIDSGSGGNIITLTSSIVCGNTPDQIDGDWTDNGGNWVADECPPDCPDINGDGYVNVTDLLVVIDQWGLTDSPADLNQDGIVDVTDLLIVVGSWGPCE